MAALAFGVAASQLADFSFTETLLPVVLLGVLAWLGLWTGASRAGLGACLAGFVICGAMLGSRPLNVDPERVDRAWIEGRDEVDDPVRLRGWVRRPPEFVGYGDRFVLEVGTLFADSAASGGVSVTVYREEDDPPLDLAYGTRVELLARLRTPRNYQNPGSFDYVGYLASHGIVLTASARAGTPIHKLAERGGSIWLSWVWGAREAARRRLSWMAAEHGADERVGDDQVEGILRALLLGERTGLTQETRQDFQRTGAYHALVISGLHVGAIAFVVLLLLRVAMVPPTARTLIGIVVVVGYAMFAGAALPVMRAAWMCSAYLVSGLVYRQRRALNVIAGTAMVFLFIEPGLLFDASFQMSFLAVGLIAGIAVPLLDATVEPYRRALIDLWNFDRDLHLETKTAQVRVGLRMWLEPLPIVTRLPRWFVTGVVVGCLRVITWAVALLIVSAVIQAGLALPMAVHFQRVSWGGVVANLFVMPLLLVTLPLGLLSLLTNSALLGSLTWSCAHVVSWIVGWVATELPVDLRVPPPLWLGVVFGLSLVCCWLSFGRGRAWRTGAWSGFAVSLALLVAHPFPPRLPAGRLELTAIDVGQGESLFLALPDGRTVLVDGGGLPDFGGGRTQTLDIGDAVVSPYLWSRSIRQLDVLAVTHSDMDHFGGVPALLDNFQVGEVWLSRVAFEEHRNRLDAIITRGIRVKFLEQGDRFQMGATTFNVLGPAVGTETYNARNNDRSLVLTAGFGEHRFLLTGDIEARAETALVDGKALGGAHVLKVAHHGSKTSTQDLFLDRVAPTFAVISAGFRNPFGHPHPTVLERLRRRGVQVLRTDLEGMISVSTDGRRLQVSTFRRERAMSSEWLRIR